MYKVLKSTGRSGSGKTAGASLSAGRTSGAIHLWDPETSRTACGREKGNGYTRTETQDPRQVITCSTCRAKM